MSHVVTVETEIRNLEALRKAAADCGMEWREGQTTHRWYGRHVGDYPLPTGFARGDLGHCLHAISVPGDRSAYEIGVVARKDGKPGYTLLFDFWGAPGRKLQAAAGHRCQKLLQHYGARVVRSTLKATQRVRQEVLANGTIRLRIS